MALVQRLRQELPVERKQDDADARQEPEDRVPAGVNEEEPADHRRDRGSDAEIDRHLRHDALRVGGREHVADHRTRDDDAGAGRHALQGAKEDQRADVLREGAADRGEREHGQPGEHDRAPAEAVRECAVEEIHDREAEQIRRQRLLHLDR